MDYSAKEDLIEYFFDRIKYLILPSKDNNYKSKFLQSNILLCVVVLLLILKIATVSVSINFPQNLFFADITKTALENLTNQTRQSLGLSPLVESQKLNEAAQLKAEDMVQNEYFLHTSPTGITPWFWFSKVGYEYKYAGENLAIGFFDSKEVFYAWLDSASHKANLLSPNYKETGIAVLNGFGQNDTTVVVQLFGTQLPSAKKGASNPANVNNASPSTTTPETEQKTETSTPAATETEKVLSQSIESRSLLESAKNTAENNFYSKFLNYVIYNYNGLLQDIIYGVSLVIIGILITIIFFSQVGFKKELIFRSLLILVLLSLAGLINNEIIISNIPHSVNIQ